MTVITPTPIKDLVVVEMQRHTDERGWFARAYDAAPFAAAGMDWTVVQANMSFNERKGTLRGLHYQAEPAAEPKFIRCIRGRVFDVAVDLRESSPTYCQWFAVHLSADEGNAVYVPPGCAHGFLTLEDATELFYFVGAPYAPELSRGVRWDDPAFGIEWPFAPTVISPRDRDYAGFTP